eukprot:4987323-Pyramimonas_sp.AAC.1
MLVYSARACHPELPVALSIMGGLFAGTTGAKVHVLVGASPLMLYAISANYPQTRKSAMHGSLGA